MPSLRVEQTVRSSDHTRAGKENVSAYNSLAYCKYQNLITANFLVTLLLHRIPSPVVTIGRIRPTGRSFTTHKQLQGVESLKS